MTDFQQALLMSGGIAAFVLIMNLGTRAFERKALIRTLAICGGVGYGYLRNVPTGGHEIAAYVVAGLLALTFGAAAIATTRVHWSPSRASVMTTCGAGFVAVWVIAVAARLGFIWEVEHNHGFRNWFGEFMMHQQIHEAAIAPFFVIWALGMVAIRMGWVAYRASDLQQRFAVTQRVPELVR